ncbi:MAG: TlpA family protein disulfide reductase [Kangiellaceae bacterium]
MKLPILYILACTFLLTATLSCTKKPEFYYTSGKSGSLSDYQGKWLIVNFWAEWCSPCRKEVEILSEIVDHNKIENLSIIGISYDQLEESELMRIVKNWGFSYPVLSTKPSPILPFSLPNQLPALYVVSPESELVAKVNGEQNLESLTKLLNSLRKE